MLYDEKGRAADYRFIEVNPAFERKTGLKNIIGKTGKDLGFNTEAYRIEEYDKIIRSGEPVHFEKYHEGTERWYHVYGSRFGDADSRLIAIVF